MASDEVATDYLPTKPWPPNVRLVMSFWIALTVFATVHTFSGYLLRVSGTWAVLAAPTPLITNERHHNPLATSPKGWIENHAFWALSDTDDDVEVDDEQAFWGARVSRHVG